MKRWSRNDALGCRSNPGGMIDGFAKSVSSRWRPGQIISFFFSRPAKPFSDFAVRFPVFESTDDFDASSVSFERAYDSFDPTAPLAQCIHFFLKRFGLPLQTMDLPDHLFFRGLGM